MKGFSRKSGRLLGLLSLSRAPVSLLSVHPDFHPEARHLLQQSNPQVTVLGRVILSRESPSETPRSGF